MTTKEFVKRVGGGETDILQLLLDMLEDAKAPYCVIGGLAVNAYAEPVVSLDLDVVVISGHWDALCETAKKLGWTVETFSHSINLTPPGSALRVQLQTDPRYQAFVERSDERPVLGYTMRVASLPDLLQGKIWAYRDEARRKSKRHKDLADILRLIEAHPELKAELPPDLREAAD